MNRLCKKTLFFCFIISTQVFCCDNLPNDQITFDNDPYCELDEDGFLVLIKESSLPTSVSSIPSSKEAYEITKKLLSGKVVNPNPEE